MVICSRKQANVQKTVDELKKFNIDVHGTVCHVGKESDRKSLVQFVSFFLFSKVSQIKIKN